MAKIRAYIYGAPGSASCPAALGNGCYNTGRIDTDAPVGQQCLNPDPQQFASLQDVIAYANGQATSDGRQGPGGEIVREFRSVEEINSICGASPVQTSPAGSGTAQPGSGGCTAGVCGPIASSANPTPASTTQPNANGTVAVAVPSGGGGNNRSPSSGGFGSASGGSTATPVSSAATKTGTQAGPTAAADGTSFDVVQFVKSPLGILVVILLFIVLLLTRKGG